MQEISREVCPAKTTGCPETNPFRRDKLKIVSLRLAKSATTINPPHVKSAQWCGKISHYFEGPAGLSAAIIIFATKILCYIVLRVLSSGLKNKNFQKTCPLIGIPKRWLVIIGISGGTLFFKRLVAFILNHQQFYYDGGFYSLWKKRDNSYVILKSFQ